MRTTVDIPNDLLSQAKKVAAQSNRTLSAVIQDALRESLARRRPRVRQASVSLTTFGRGGLNPGVDLDDSAALLDAMDAVDGPARR